MTVLLLSFMAIFFAAALILPLVAALLAHNRMVRERNLVLAAQSNIWTELQRRHELIPNLVATVRGYAQHERQVLEEVTRARAAALGGGSSMGQHAALEERFGQTVQQLLAVAEQYPVLQSNQNFLALQSELANTEDRIQSARRLYNTSAAEYNTRLQSVPWNLVAGLGGLRQAELFEVDPAMRAAVSWAPTVQL